MKGLFITFEGPDGSGKTTQMRLLGQRLQELGRDVVFTREPGGTRLSEEIRELLLNPANTEMADRTEALLYAAARAQHVEQFIKPAMGRGQVVLCDRFTDSTLAYQGYGRGIDLGLLRLLNDMATAGVMPDITLVFDIEPELGLARISRNRGYRPGQDKDRMEAQHIEFHKKVRAGFRRLVDENPGRCKTIDAAKSLDEVSQEVFRIIDEVLKR